MAGNDLDVVSLRTTNVLLTLVVVTLAAGFLSLGAVPAEVAGFARVVLFVVFVTVPLAAALSLASSVTGSEEPR
jgi:uncharacterized membrane protein YtjA (UPF0391 family)